MGEGRTSSRPPLPQWQSTFFKNCDCCLNLCLVQFISYGNFDSSWDSFAVLISHISGVLCHQGSELIWPILAALWTLVGGDSVQLDRGEKKSSKFDLKQVRLFRTKSLVWRFIFDLIYHLTKHTAGWQFSLRCSFLFTFCSIWCICLFSLLAATERQN